MVSLLSPHLGESSEVTEAIYTALALPAKPTVNRKRPGRIRRCQGISLSLGMALRQFG